LTHAIDHTTLSRLQCVLKQICDSSPAAATLVEEQLLAPPTAIVDLTDDNTDSAPIESNTGAKRQRYAMCENCKEEFDVTDNDEDSCQYHDVPGMTGIKDVMEQSTLAFSKLIPKALCGNAVTRVEMQRAVPLQPMR
ncbi:unnamed protein product, partial [Aureobasidium vineae]